jgi:hypothetical protein
MMLDEVDKIGTSLRGDPAAALLEVLDPEQNHTFRDHYLGLPFDLSRVVFIATANVMDAVPAPVRDRMEVIELPGYTQEEKLQIARRYLMGRQLEVAGLSPDPTAILTLGLLLIARRAHLALYVVPVLWCLASGLTLWTMKAPDAFIPVLAAIVAAAAMAGVPLLNGFLSKEMFLAETLALDGHQALRLLVPVAATVAAALSVAYSVRFVHDVFFNGTPVDLPRTPHEPPRWMRVPVELLVVLCLLVGLAPTLTVGPLLALAARDVLGGTLPEYSLSVWHGFNAALAMSAAALAGGTVLYFWLQRSRSKLHRVADDEGAGKRGFEHAIEATVRVAGRFTELLHGGGARRTLLLAVLVAIAAGGMPWLGWPVHVAAVLSVALEITSRAFKIQASARACGLPIRLSTAFRVCLAGDFAASVNIDDGGAIGRFFVLFGSLSGCEYRTVFEQEHGFWFLTRSNGSVNFSLSLPS